MKRLGLPLLWLVTALFLVRSFFSDRFDPARAGTARYGHNGPNELLPVLLVTCAELVLFSLILRPRSYERSWLRALLAFCVCAPWTFCAIALSMHSGGIFLVHLLWLVVLTLGFATCVVVSGIAAARAR